MTNGIRLLVQLGTIHRIRKNDNENALAVEAFSDWTVPWRV